MISFFRKIRKGLVTESKFKKYLLYAVGEIILVVIGILIALQINSWNDYRKERKSEQLILHNFKNNLETDIELLNQFQDGAEIGLKAVDTTLLIVNGHLGFNFNSFSSSIEKILSNNYFQSTTTTFDQAISTGKIDLILDDKLRSELLYYYKLTKLNFDDNRMLETNQKFVFPSIFSTVVPTKTIAHALTGIENNLPELDLEALGKNREFITWVLFKKSAFQRQSQNYMFLKDEVEHLIEMINGQLQD